MNQPESHPHRKRWWAGLASIGLVAAVLVTVGLVAAPRGAGPTAAAADRASSSAADPPSSTAAHRPSSTAADRASSTAADPPSSTAPSDDPARLRNETAVGPHQAPTTGVPSSGAPAGAVTGDRTSRPPAAPSDGTTRPTPDPPAPPAERVVNVGYRFLTTSTPASIDRLATRLDQVHATGVSLAVGRLNWLLFDWKGHPDTESNDVKDSGRDYIAEAIAAFGHDQYGHPRRITLGIDTLVPREIAAHPDLAGVSAGGSRSTEFASVTAWKSGYLTNQLVALAGELADRYHPAAVNITELMFIDAYGPADLADYERTEHTTGWPRTPTGQIDTNDPRLQHWLTDAAGRVLAPVKKRLAASGVELTMDVRAPATPDPAGQPGIGQDYPGLLRYADQLNVWDFPGTESSGALDAARLGPLLFAAQPDRYNLEIGLWDGAGTIPDSVLDRELRSAQAQHLRSVAVTPAALFTDRTWAILQHHWATPPEPD